MNEIVALVLDIGLGAAALHLAHSLNRTIKSLDDTVRTIGESVNDHSSRIRALESKRG